MRKTSRVGAAAAGALAAALLAGAFTATQASTAGTTAAKPSVPVRSMLPSSVVRSTGTSGSTVTNSTTTAATPEFAGYFAAGGTTTFRTVSAHFTVPYLDCKGVTNTEGAGSLHWVGLGGTERTGVSAACQGTTAVYKAFWAFYPDVHFPSITVHAGNSVQMTVYFHSTTHEYTFSLTDSTDGQQFSRTAACTTSCNRSDADAITEVPFNSAQTAFLPLADFQAVAFENVHITNTSGTHTGGLQSSNWNTFRLIMVAENPLNFTITGAPIPAGTPLAKPTALYHKNSFLTYWMPANAG
jgi:Peptidase A4 family